MSQGVSTSQALPPRRTTIVQFETEPTKELERDVRSLISRHGTIINYCKGRSQKFFNDYYENRTVESLTCLLRFFSAQARELEQILPIYLVARNEKEPAETDRYLSFVPGLNVFINRGLEEGKYRYAIKVSLDRFSMITDMDTMNDMGPFPECSFTAANQEHVEKLGVLLAMLQAFKGLFNYVTCDYLEFESNTYDKVSKVLKDGFFEMCTKTDELDRKHENYPLYDNRKVMNILSNRTELELLPLIDSSEGWSDLADKVLRWLHEDTFIRFDEPVHPVNMDVEACVEMANAIYISIMKTLHIVFHTEKPIVDPDNYRSYFN